MRFATWNLRHVTRHRRISSDVVAAIHAIEPDLLVLTEYVAARPRPEFHHELHELGLHHIVETTPAHGHNQILVASRWSATQRPLIVPAGTFPFESNVALVRVNDAIDVLGLRIPHFKSSPAKRLCWDWILQQTSAISASAAITIGDFNTDPSYTKAKCGDRLVQLASKGWHHAMPEHGASYWTPRGTAVRIDHAFVTPLFTVEKAEYVCAVGEIPLVGKGRASDHAMLVVDADLAT